MKDRCARYSSSPLRLGNLWRPLPRPKTHVCVHRISFTSPQGHTCFISPADAQKRLDTKRAEWIEKGVSMRAVVRQNYVDYSAVQTDRCRWEPWDSDGATVMQLL
jgi:hypothetical protein